MKNFFLQMLIATAIILSSNSLYAQESYEITSVAVGDIERVYVDGSFENEVVWGDSYDVSYTVVIDGMKIVFDNSNKSTYYLKKTIASDNYFEEGKNVVYSSWKAVDEEDISCDFTIYNNGDEGQVSFIATYTNVVCVWQANYESYTTL